MPPWTTAAGSLETSRDFATTAARGRAACNTCTRVEETKLDMHERTGPLYILPPKRGK